MKCNTGQRAAMLALLNAVADGSGADNEPRIVRHAETARRLGVCLRTVQTLAKRGALVPVYFPGRKRRVGFTDASVRRLAEGGGV